MKMKLGQKLTLAAGLMFASVLVYEAPFEANAANSQSQVVFAPINEPPVIGNEPARIDFPLLLLELGMVAFVGGGIYFASGQYRSRRPGSQ
mgnify:FL=1